MAIYQITDRKLRASVESAIQVRAAELAAEDAERYGREQAERKAAHDKIAEDAKKSYPDFEQAGIRERITAFEQAKVTAPRPVRSAEDFAHGLRAGRQDQ